MATHNDDCIVMVKKLLKQHKISYLSETLDVSTSTIKRWLELNDVPKMYQFDLYKLCNVPVDYSKFSSKEKDQFFTNRETAQYCLDVFISKAKQLGIDTEKYEFIEPSAGDGAFMKVLPKKRVIGIDIEPRYDDVIEHDFLTWRPREDGKYIVFGNPPFGLRGNLALRFINHAATFADFVCFILPQLFESDGKGVPRKRVKGLNLVHSEKLDTTFYAPDKSSMKINVIFQIWSKHFCDEKFNLPSNTSNDVVKVYSLSDGGTPASTRNKQMLEKCDVYLPSTCFGKENMKCYKTFQDLPGKKGYGLVFSCNKDSMIEKCMSTDWSSLSFLSTNSALNLRTSTIHGRFVN